MIACFFLTDLTHSDHLLNQGMIPGDLLYSVTDHIQTAVANIGNIGILIYNSSYHHSGSHTPEVRILLCTVSDFRIGSFNGMTNDLYRIVIRIFTDFIHKDPNCM